MIAPVSKGINIFSGEAGLGGALTNPTVLARRKGCITQGYPVTVHGKQYPDVEAAYHALATGDVAADDQLMHNLISQKFLSHPRLQAEVTRRGGTNFLAACSHFTKATSAGGQAWEGQGTASRFIRNLIIGYELSLKGEAAHLGQTALF